MSSEDPVKAQVTADKSDSPAVTDDDEDTTAARRRPAGWTATYSRLSAKLPPAVSARLPTSDEAERQVSQLSDKWDTLSAASKDKWDDWSKRSSESYGKAKRQYRASRLNPERMFDKAWSVTNETNIALNISLNQVGPLHYAVVLPNDTFSVRVPNLWYALEIRPWTGSSSAYTLWSTTWPILAVAGPVSAATSLVAIPFVALAAGGTALASLTSFGSAAASGVASAGSAMSGAGAKAAKLATGAAALPGAKRIRGKLVDATRRNVSENSEMLTGKLVRYFAKNEGSTIKPVRGATADKLDEVDVTGYELDKVLKCDTGKSKVDKALENAFAKLSMKEKRLKTQDNPVLRVVGGPELEERGDRQWLVFYPFVVEQVVDVGVEPVPPSEVPPTADEQAFMRDARVVPTTKQAEAAIDKAPKHGQGDDESVDSAVEEAVHNVAEDDADVQAQKVHHEEQEKQEQEQEKSSADASKQSSSWFSWGRR